MQVARGIFSTTPPGDVWSRGARESLPGAWGGRRAAISDNSASAFRLASWKFLDDEHAFEFGMFERRFN